MKQVIKGIAIVFALLLVLPSSARNKQGYVVVTDHIKAKEWRSGDVSDALQRIIDENPNRTIFFPDGEYIISKPILTSSEPTKSVSISLSAYAIIRAAEGWSHDEAMIRLGAKNRVNNITTPGSNYYFEGGIIDCNGVAKAISIDGGRETVVRNCSIKRAVVGLHIKRGVNSGSSDCDISGVNITGCESPQSVGVLIEGYDNTLTNMRIGGVHIGVIIRSGANSLRNIHPLYYSRNAEYASSCGFVDESGNNYYDFCYSDEFATAFRITKSRRSSYTNCFAYWYSKRGSKHLVFKADGAFNACVRGLVAGFGRHNATKENKILECDKSGGKGVFDNLFIRDTSVMTDHSHEAYIK
ncbi:MAG: hypothetical protein II214_06685 [Alistipes sp.]|nr:hypothetical protein [Alistipes sp.]